MFVGSPGDNKTSSTFGGEIYKNVFELDKGNNAMYVVTM